MIWCVSWPNQFSKIFVFHKPSSNNLCIIAGYLVLIKDSIVIIENCCYEGGLALSSWYWYCWYMTKYFLYDFLQNQMFLSKMLLSNFLFCHSLSWCHHFSRIKTHTYPAAKNSQGNAKLIRLSDYILMIQGPVTAFACHWKLFWRLELFCVNNTIPNTRSVIMYSFILIKAICWRIVSENASIHFSHQWILTVQRLVKGWPT